LALHFVTAAAGAYISMTQLFRKQIVGVIYLFEGRVEEPMPSRTQVTMKLHSDLELLNIEMPRNVVKPGCYNDLWDAGCGLLKALFTVSSSAATSSTKTQILCSLAQAAGYFDLGTIEFSSGQNSGVKRTIKSYTPGTINLSSPLPYTPAPGDTFDAAPGCDKTESRCDTIFNNKANRRTFPYVPVPETSL
jgi:uncharacterized phage protein (TIGR02218 family)